MDLPLPLPARCLDSGSGSAYSVGDHHCHEKNLVSFYFASPIILCPSQFGLLISNPLLPLGSTDSLATLTMETKRKPSQILIRKSANPIKNRAQAHGDKPENLDAESRNNFQIGAAMWRVCEQS